MSEKVARLGVRREPGFFYFLRGDEIWRTPLKRAADPRPPSGAGAELVVAGGFVREEGWLYFFDNDGDVSRAARSVSPTRNEPASDAKPIDLALAQEILAVRRPDGTEPVAPYLRAAERLQAAGHEARAEFIRRQCAGEDAADLFARHRACWGIPEFDEQLVVAGDFRRGFLHTFRDHSDSWSDNQAARRWFFTSPEARFAVRYQFWSCDDEPEECTSEHVGSYKQIVDALLDEGMESALACPLVSREQALAWAEKMKEEFDDDAVADWLKLNPHCRK
jgi:hypothetical protein